MPLFRYAFVALMLFALTGVSEVMAAPKPVKAKITRQPVASAVDLGASVTLRVVFSSPTPATCQWRRNRVPLPEATESEYVIDTVLPEDAGSYDVLITNAAGVTASKPAAVTVNLAPASLPVDAVIHGDFTIKALGQLESSDGAYLVTGVKTLQDPEAPEDSYTFTYARQPKNKASLVISGSFYDADLGANVSVKDTLSLTFTGVSDDGELLATVSGKGVYTLPGGKKVNFTSTGTIAVQLTPPPEESAGTVIYSGSVVFNGVGSVNTGGMGSAVGTLTIRNVSQPGTQSGTNTYSYTYSGVNSGTLTIGGTQGTFMPSVRDLVSLTSGATLVLGPGGTFTGATTLNSGTLSLGDGFPLSFGGLTTEPLLPLPEGQLIFVGGAQSITSLFLDGQLLDGIIISGAGTLTYSSLNWVSVP